MSVLLSVCFFHQGASLSNRIALFDSTDESDSIKSKLSPNNSAYFMCPARDGSTITISLEKADHQQNTRRRQDDSNGGRSSPLLCELIERDLVIVALRLLVGSTETEFIPKYVSVEGRRVWLKPDLKKHYDLPLTAEEIASSLRNGFVSLGIGPSFDSGNNPLIDAVEVYAAKREQICHWLPLSCSEMHSATVQEDAETDDTVTRPEESILQDKLALSVEMVTHLLQILQTSSEISSESQETVRTLIETSALEDGSRTRQSLITLLPCIEPDSSKQKKMLDEGTLAGVWKALHSAGDNLGKRSARSNGPSSQSGENTADVINESGWRQWIEEMKRCLNVAATVAEERPRNYKEILQKAVKEKSMKCSLALLADSVLQKCTKEKLEFQKLIPDFVELCLAEALLFHDQNETLKSSFASFDIVARLLGSTNEEIVNVCCGSILAYWKQHLSQAGPVIEYQCDSCDLFPLTGARYTLPDSESSSAQDSDLDLCSDCFRIGRSFAERNQFDARVHVKIGNKTVGKDSKLSCARLSQMKRVSISKTSLRSADPEVSSGIEGVSSMLFNDLIGLLSDMMKKKDLAFPLTSFQSILDLLLNVVKISGEDFIMLERAKVLAETISERIQDFIDVIADKNELEVEARSIFVVCMQGLARLAKLKIDESDNLASIDLDDCSVEDVSASTSNEKTDARFVCEAHGVPAVRRKCSQEGANKNRRFYVCGMDRKSRCSYFKWADSEDGRQLIVRDEEKCAFTDGITRFLWELLNKADGDDCLPLSIQLCGILEGDVDNGLTGGRADVPDASADDHELPTMPSRYDRLAATSDYLDGVFCSLEKIRGVTSQMLLGDGHNEKGGLSSTGRLTVFTATLDLLACISDPATVDDTKEGEHEPSKWFPLLCETISSSKSPQHRLLAKRALKRLCGGNKVVYQRIHDHFVFGFKFHELLLNVKPALLAALNVKEQARQCGVYWRNGEKATFRELPAGGLIGTSDLVSEDCVTVERDRMIRATLDELLSSSNQHIGNWRKFCSLSSLPKRREQGKNAPRNRGADVTVDIFAAPPIVSLVWIACSLSGENQVKALRLINAAMIAPRGASARKNTSSKGTSSSQRESESDVPEESKALLRFCTPSSLPENILLQGERALLADEVHAFVVQFVLSGNSTEVRKAGEKVSLELCKKFEDEDSEWLFSQLTNRALVDLPEIGTNANELFKLLSFLASCGVAGSTSTLLPIARKVVNAFIDQMRSLGHGALTLPGEKQSEASSAATFDLTCCAHCQRDRVSPSSVAPDSSSGQSRAGSNGTTGASRTATANVTVGQNFAMLPEQIRPFARESLDTSVEASLSTEFSMYAQLKCRMAISGIHVSIGDPRGRYVKTIAVYFSPRQVSDPNVLKSEEYETTWQQCATISLARGATRANCTISPPIIAANLRIEYLEFYERPGGSRAEDGSLLLHCPRCTRVVNNAHGVCAHCGEVAMQCRKCRHINYLQLDAFLCVECGYCSAASFSYDLTCGAASNAVAVVDDDSYERSIKLMRVATKLHDELRSTLNDKIRPSGGKRSVSMQKYGPSLKRAFLGELPKIRMETAQSSGQSLADISSSSAGGSAGNRARTLLRLAQQLRNESSASDRSRVNDLLVRQSLLGSSGAGGLSIDDMEEMDSDMVGSLPSDVEGQMDPLSRLVASIQGRPGRSGASGSRSARNRSGDGTQSGNGDTTEGSSKVTPEECQRLYDLMREAECECNELRRRINAWKRLENDALADLGTAKPTIASFTPSQCSKCSGPLARQLLNLFMALFEANSEVVEPAIAQNFIRALFDETSKMDKELFDTKRAAIVNLAAKSEMAAKLILEQLRLRMHGAGDAASAQILGKIIATDSLLGEDFVKLAGEILDSGY